MTSFPNTGPEHPEPPDPSDAGSVRRENVAPVLRAGFGDVVQTASTRASSVSHRFHGARHALVPPDRPAMMDVPATQGQSADGGLEHMGQTTVDITTVDGVADAYLVRPDEEGSFPGVLLYMDAFGLRPRLAEMAARIAAQGYVVLVPNLLYRGGPAPLVDLAGLAEPERRNEIIGQLMPRVMALNTESITSDTAAYLDALAGQDGVAAGPVAVVGYCMGGTNALRAIEAFPDRIAAVASFHGGRLATDAPDSPHLRVGQITGELYFGHADQDHSMTADQIKTLEAALDEAGVTYRSEVYAGAPHGFTMSDTPAYQEAGERRHWTNLFALLERTFG